MYVYTSLSLYIYIYIYMYLYRYGLWLARRDRDLAAVRALRDPRPGPLRDAAGRAAGLVLAEHRRIRRLSALSPKAPTGR